MTARRLDPVVAAILAQMNVVHRRLTRMRVPASARPDIAQEVVIAALDAVRRGTLDWLHPPAVRGFLRIVARRATSAWKRANPLRQELRGDEGALPSPEAWLVAKSMLRFLRASTTPERWRAVMAYAKGITVAEIAARERVPVATIYTRIRLARLDFAAALARDDAAIYVRRRR